MAITGGYNAVQMSRRDAQSLIQPGGPAAVSTAPTGWRGLMQAFLCPGTRRAARIEIDATTLTGSYGPLLSVEW